jgi:alpha-ribazole phosphatase
VVTILYLIRHGETEGAETKRYKGSIDVLLSQNGVKQMEEVSEYLFRSIRNSPSPGGTPGLLDAVYCSDLSRAMRSAEIIGAPYPLDPIVVPALRERNFGVWEGMTFDEIRARYPDEFGAWAGNPLKFSPMGGESTQEVTARAVGAIKEITSAHAGKQIAVISHGGVTRILLCHFLGVPLENIFRIDQDYAALNIIELWDQYPVVKLVNGVTYGRDIG